MPAAFDFHKVFDVEPIACRVFQTELSRVNAALDLETLKAEVERFTSALEFERYGVLLLHDDFSSKDSCIRLGSIDNAPLSYQEVSESKDLAKADPVHQHCKHHSLPIAYGPDTYLKAGRKETWERQAEHGFAYGIASVFHLPRNRHVLFGIDRTASLPRSRSDLLDLVARVHLFGTFVQSAAIALLQPAQTGPVAQPIRLSRRQRECLQWAAEGKTAWETGMILSIAEGSVAKILASAIRKLDCASKPHAVVKALRLGLIH